MSTPVQRRKREPTELSTREARMRFSDMVNRVLYRGEHFLISRNGQVVAAVGPAPRRRRAPKATDAAVAAAV